MAKPLVPKTIFSFSVLQHANERQSFFYQRLQKISALRGFEGICRQFSAGFSPANIFRICQSPSLQILAPNTSFFPLPKIGANSLQTALPCNYSTCFAKRHTRANRAQKRRNLLARLFFRIFILCFASVKVLPCGYLLQAPSFFLRPKSGQIRSKLLCPATTSPTPQSGTQGQTGRKKGEPFNGSSCHVVFCSVYSYSLLIKTTPNLIGFFQEILSFVFA